MDLTLYNTLSKRKEPFTVRSGAPVSIYACGPTVYGMQHIGNLRSAMTADIVVRTLTLLGYNTHYVSNITDVGHLTDDDIAQGDSGQDKMLAAAEREQKTPEDIARFYEEAYRRDTAALHITPPAERPRATEHIDAMIAMIEKLIDRGHAYVSNGNVFYDVSSFPRYGALSGNTPETLKVGARLTNAHPDKRNQWDFALWLSAPPSHLMRWASPWSVGYPGWHIECSAMSTHYLGMPIDIHCGGEDNIFPHHEAEIAQSEGAEDTHPFVRYWVHTRHLLVDGKKMSKSAGTTYTLADVRERGFTPADLRLLYLQSHYRSQMNFTWDALHQARKNRHTITAAYQAVQLYAQRDELGTEALDTDRITEDFRAALCDDLNTPRALSVVMTARTTVNTMIANGTLSNVADVLAMFELFNMLLALPFDEKPQEEDIPADIDALVRQREDARHRRDFARADELRNAIEQHGYNVTDTADGPVVTRQ